MSTFKRIEELAPVVADFWSAHTGMLMFHHAPGSGAKAWLEHLVSRKDIDETTAQAADWLLKKFGAMKIEISSQGGEMTKLKITRQL